MQTYTTSYFRENLSEIVSQVSLGESAILILGRGKKAKKIKLTPLDNSKPKKQKTSVQKLIEDLSPEIENSKNKKPEYSSNREMYDDLLKNY